MKKQQKKINTREQQNQENVTSDYKNKSVYSISLYMCVWTTISSFPYEKR